MNKKNKKLVRAREKSVPIGYQKIVNALKSLLADRSFRDITWREIAIKAGVSEALIYQYFRTRNNLLFTILADYLKVYRRIIWRRLDKATDASNKIRILIDGLLEVYDGDRVFARVIMLEVRNFPEYYDSEAYALTQEMGKKFVEVLEEGKRKGQIRKDISSARMRQVLLGAVEHSILPYLIFRKKIDFKVLSRDLNALMIQGLQNR